MSVQDIEIQPAFMGEVDVVKSLQWLPGVSAVGEGAAGFNVRGGRIDQNLVLLDGAPIFNPTHLLGFFSSVQSDIVESFTLYKGQVPAYYGGRAASVLDIQTRYGNADSLRIRAGLGVVSARLAVEGPVGRGGASFLVGGRSSYSDWMLRRAEDYSVRTSSGNFQDVYAGLRIPVSDRQIIETYLYGSRDRFQFSNQFGFDYQTGLAGIHWYLIPKDNLSLEITGHAGRYDSDFFDPSGFDAGRASTGLTYYHGRQQALWTPGWHTLRVGMEQSLYDMLPGTLEPEGLQSAQVPASVPGDRGLEWAFFVDDIWELSAAFSVEAGLRYVTYAQLGEATEYVYDPALPKSPTSIIDSLTFGPWEPVTRYGGWEPRISFRWRITENTSLKASYNRLQQFIHLISNTAAPTPVDLWQTANYHLLPQKTDQYSVGLFQNFDAHRWESSVEAFFKDQNQLIEYQDFASLLTNPYLETDLVNAVGIAYGAEAIVRKKRGRLTGWLGYTYARSFVRTVSEFEEENVNNGEWFPAPYDQPHQVDLVANLNLGRGSFLGVNGTFRSGRPFSALETSFEQQNTIIPLFSERNQYRIPNYFRIDVSIALGSIVSKWEDQLVFSVYNLLQRRNAYSIFYQRPSNAFIPKAYQLSMLGAGFPSLTYNVDF